MFLQSGLAMKTSRSKPLERRIAERIARKKGNVFVRRDFQDLGGYDQVGRALRRLTFQGHLVRIGYGLYARTVRSLLSGKRVPAQPLPSLTLEALARLEVETRPSRFAQASNTGKTTQVPTGRVIAVKGRIARKIGYDGKYVSFERFA